VAGKGGDDFFTVVGRSFPHDGAEDFDEFVGLVVGHADGTGTDELGAVGLDDPAADAGTEVATEGFVDLGAEALVAEDEGDFLEKLVTIEPGLATSGWRNAAMMSSVSISSMGVGRADDSGVGVG